MVKTGESVRKDIAMTIMTHKQFRDLLERADLHADDPSHFSREVAQALFFGKNWTIIKWLGERLNESPDQVLADLEAYRAGHLVCREEPVVAAPIIEAPAIIIPKPPCILTPDQVRQARARHLFILGFNHGVRGTTAKTFNQYLAGIPSIPDSLFEDDIKLIYLPLADPRPGLTMACGLIKIRYAEFGYNDNSVEPWDGRYRDPLEPFWFRCDDGRPNRNRKPEDCCTECISNRLAGTAMTGIMAYAHFPKIMKESEHAIDLPGSVCRVHRANCASLEVWNGQFKLLMRRGVGFASPSCGSLVLRREC